MSLKRVKFWGLTRKETMPSLKSLPYALIHGDIVPIDKAQVSIMTNALHYGTGVFSGIKGYRSAQSTSIFRLTDHIERLRSSCVALGFPFSFDAAKIEEYFIELTRRNKPSAITYYRPLIYRSDTQLAPDITGEYDFALYMLEMPSYFSKTEGLSVCISEWQRNSSSAIPPQTKATGGYINSALAIHAAKQAGYDSAIMLTNKGTVSEGAVMNIFLVKDNVLITPDIESDILAGITRRTVLELAKEMHIKTVERVVMPQELLEADEIFFSGTATDITWCKSISNTLISEQKGPLTAQLQMAYKDLIKTHPHLFTAISY